MRDSVDAQEGVVEVADLWRAETPDDLHRVLALYEPIRRSADSWEPFQLLVKHHVAGSEDSPVTAMLLLTDRRWSKGVGQLVRRIEEAGILASEELDILAEAFVRTDQALYWAIPDNWFGEGSIVIDVGPGSPPSGDDEEPVEPSDRPALAKRDVHPPLRRWASARLVGRDPPVWGGLLTRARDLGGALAPRW